MPGTNRYKQAFRERANIGGLSVLVVLSAACMAISTGVGAGLLAGAAVLEAFYLGFIPKSARYADILRARYDKEVVARREKLKLEVGPTLPPSLMARFGRLETTRNQIGSQTVEGKQWFREVLLKLDYLMEKFLLFASKQVQFQTYLASVMDETEPGTVAAPPSTPGPMLRPTIKRTDPGGEVDEYWIQGAVGSIQKRYTEEIDGLDVQMKMDENLHNQAVMDKRKDVLIRRRQYVSQIGEILSNLNHQLHLMEDTFGLINDEIRARSPEQVLMDIEDLVGQTDSLTETLQRVSPFEHMPVAAGAGKLYNVSGEK